jgi:hypothetical protein
MGRKAIAAEDRRIVHGFSIAPLTRERIEAITDKTGESNGVLLDRLVAAEYVAVVTKRKRKS